MAGPLAPGPLMDREQSREQSGPLMDREQSREQSGASLASHQAGATVCHSPLARSVGRGGRVRARVSQWVGGWGTCTHIHMYASSRWVGGAKVGQRWGTPTREYMLLYSLDPHTHSRTYGTCCCTRWIPILTHVRTVTLWPDEQIGADERHERLLPHLHTCMHAPTCIRTHMHAYLRPDEQIGGDERLLHQTT